MKKKKSDEDEKITCPYCGAEHLSEGDIVMCPDCGAEICDVCAGDHGCGEPR